MGQINCKQCDFVHIPTETHTELQKAVENGPKKISRIKTQYKINFMSPSHRSKKGSDPYFKSTQLRGFEAKFNENDVESFSTKEGESDCDKSQHSKKAINKPQVKDTFQDNSETALLSFKSSLQSFCVQIKKDCSVTVGTDSECDFVFPSHCLQEHFLIFLRMDDQGRLLVKDSGQGLGTFQNSNSLNYNLGRTGLRTDLVQVEESYFFVEALNNSQSLQLAILDENSKIIFATKFRQERTIAPLDLSIPLGKPGGIPVSISESGKQVQVLVKSRDAWKYLSEQTELANGTLLRLGSSVYRFDRLKVS